MSSHFYESDLSLAFLLGDHPDLYTSSSSLSWARSRSTRRPQTQKVKGIHCEGLGSPGKSEKLLSVVRRLFTAPKQVVLGVDARRETEPSGVRFPDSQWGFSAWCQDAGTTGETEACKGWTQASFCTEPSPAMVLGLETEE